MIQWLSNIPKNLIQIGNISFHKPSLNWTNLQHTFLSSLYTLEYNIHTNFNSKQKRNDVLNFNSVQEKFPYEETF